jgi:hypothetical protein
MRCVHRILSILPGVRAQWISVSLHKSPARARADVFYHRVLVFNTEWQAVQKFGAGGGWGAVDPWIEVRVGGGGCLRRVRDVACICPSTTPPCICVSKYNAPSRKRSPARAWLLSSLLLSVTVSHVVSANKSACPTQPYSSLLKSNRPLGKEKYAPFGGHGDMEFNCPRGIAVGSCGTCHLSPFCAQLLSSLFSSVLSFQPSRRASRDLC